MSVPVQRLSHIGVKVTDLARSLEWYERVLGFRVHLDQRGGVLPGHETVVGIVAGVAVELICDDAPPPRPPDPDGLGFSCLSFSVPDLDEATGALRDAGVTEIVGPVTFPIAAVVFFRDPDGNLLELIQLPAGAKALADVEPPTG